MQGNKKDSAATETTAQSLYERVAKLENAVEEILSRTQTLDTAEKHVQIRTSENVIDFTFMKPCPICGGKPYGAQVFVYSNIEGTSVSAYCSVCVRVTRPYYDFFQLQAAWNDRRDSTEELCKKLQFGREYQPIIRGEIHSLMKKPVKAIYGFTSHKWHPQTYSSRLLNNRKKD